jgi:hypothetical protein
MRFLGGALFGCLVSVGLLGGLPWIGWQWRWESAGYIYWILPLVCGGLAVLWFDEVLDLAARFFERVAGDRT